MHLIKETQSLCPECLTAIKATIYEENRQVLIKKTCPKHGDFQDIYWSDYDEYLRAEKFRHEGDGLYNPRTKTERNCPYDCGICPNHKSHTILAIIDVTNRCNLKCPVCFANAATAGYVYEPAKEQIREILENFWRNEPVKPPALQFSGGEPTIREDLPELVKIAKEVGFNHVEVNSNGIRLAESVDYCRELLDAGVSTIYLQFDGVTPDVYKVTRGRDLLKTKLKAIENCRKAGLDSIVLVPTIVKGVNDDQLGDIIKFAVENADVVRAVNFQPVSITGRVDYDKRKEMRITIPDCIKLIEEQTDGQIKTSDFYTVPFVTPISQAIGALKDKRYVEFTVHPHCGMATYIFPKDGKFVPITRYIYIEKFVETMEKVYQDAKKGGKRRAKLRLLGATRHIKWSILRPFVTGILMEGSYEALGKLHRKMIMVGMMHFMDPYNFDLERVQRCAIHYGLPDGRIIPFCTMNSIHRQTVEKKFSISLEHWQKQRLSMKKAA